MGEIFEEYSEKNRADLPPLTIIQGGGTVYRDESNQNLQFDKNSLSNYKAVNPDDFIVHLRSFEGGLEKATCCGLISPAYHTFHGDGIDSDFYYLYFRSKRFIDTDLKPHVYGIRDGRSIDIDGMKTIPIPWTTVNEQRAIGGFYNSFDSFITLHQRKCQYRGLYGCLSWEQRKLGDLISVYIAHAGPEEDVTVLTSSRDGIQKQEDHFGRLQQHDTSDWNLIPYGYCTYRNRSDDGLFTFNVNKVADRGIVSKFYPVFETSECDADFLVAYLNSSQEIRKKLFVLAVGTSQVVLSYGALKELSLLLPQNREQSAIANVLNHIDNLITLHQRKCQYRGLYGCLSWEQRKLGDLISVYIAHAGPEEDVTVLTSSRDGIQKQEDHFGRLQQHDTSDWNLIPYGYCTYRNRSDDGLFTFNVNKVADRGIVSKFYPVFETSECDADFLVAYLNSSQEIRKKLFVLAVGTSQVVLSYGALKELSLLLPQNREQSAIANVLNHIDNLITLHQ